MQKSLHGGGSVITSAFHLQTWLPETIHQVSALSCTANTRPLGDLHPMYHIEGLPITHRWSQIAMGRNEVKQCTYPLTQRDFGLGVGCF